jgi:hypothetical protein
MRFLDHLIGAQRGDRPVYGSSGSGSGNFISVKQSPYSATGNGTTNDSAAIQAAIDAVALAGGGTVFFPRGTYIAGGLSWPNNVILRGEGQGRDMGAVISLLKLPNSSAAGSYIIASSSFIANAAFVNLGQAVFDLGFDGNKANQGANDALANVITRCFSARFFNCYFTRSSGHGVLLTCESANGTDGASIANSDFLECDFTDCDFAGLFCDDDGVNNLADVFVRGCVFAFNGQVDDANKWRNLMIERGAGCHVIDNQMYGCPNGNLLMQAASLAIINSNHFDGGAIGDSDANVELNLGGFAQLSVTGNMFWNDAGSGTSKTHLLLVKGSTTFQSVAVVGNTFSYTTAGVGAAIFTTGFATGEPERLMFSGNQYHPLSLIPLNQSGAWAIKMKTADEARTSSTTLANDNTLTLDMISGIHYFIRGKIFYDTPTAADFKWRHAGPAAFAVRVKRSSIAPGANAFGNVAVDVAYSAADIVILETAGTTGYIEFEAIIASNTAGTFAFQWAQNTSNASATTVLGGSYIEYQIRT